MKVVLAAKSVYPFHPFGGVQKYVYYYALALHRLGIDVTVVAPLDDGQPREELVEGVKFVLLKPSIYKYLELPVGWLGVHRFAHSLDEYLAGIEFDILHSFDMVGLTYAKRSVRKKVIGHIFTDNFLVNPIGFAHLGDFLGVTTAKIKQEKLALTIKDDVKQKLLYPWQYIFKVFPMHAYVNDCDIVCVEDQSFVDDVCQIYQLSSKTLRVLPVGVHVGASLDGLKRSQMRKEYGFDPGDIVLITVNRLAADKGIDQLIKAVALLRTVDLRYKLLIVGQGYFEAELLRLIDDLGLSGAVRHVKSVPEGMLLNYYQLADIYVCAFSYAGSSVSSLEAMSVGLPIVTTAQPWLARGIEGLFCKDNQPVKLVKAIRELTERSMHQPLIEKARQTALNYTWDALAKEGLTMYKELVRDA